MKKAYSKPMLFYRQEPVAFIPAIMAAAVGAGLALGASSAAATGVGLAALGGAAAATAAGGAALGAAVAKKVGQDYFGSRECLPALDVVEAA
jgi:hypothetical protein